jgi:enamine deaminase RidA (YjgF/YER057c/UK114 family)
VADDVPVTVEEIAGRPHASSGSPWEPRVGYCRAVRSGDLIAVSGTVGINSDGSYPHTVGDQTRRALAIIRAAVEALGGRLEDVVRTRMFVTDIAGFDEVGRVHGEVFGAVRPATSMVEVSRLVDEAALIEIEADAVVAPAAAAPGAARFREQHGERRPDDAARAAQLREARAAFESRYIAEVLREYGGNVSRAAAVLGLSRMQLHRKIREYDIH